jgi:hypothetical protein
MLLAALVMHISFCRGLRDIRNFRSAVGVLFLASFLPFILAGI